MMNMVQFKGTTELQTALEPLMSITSAGAGGTIYSGESLGVIYFASTGGGHKVVNYIRAQHFLPSGDADYWVFYDTDGNIISLVSAVAIYGVLFLMNYPEDASESDNMNAFIEE